MTNINWGIIGCGNVTEVKSGPAFNKIPGSRLVAVMRRDASKAADYAKRHGVPRWYSDADLLMNDEEVNAIYIATPPASHLHYAIAALRKGLNVYVEKPVTLTALEAKQLADVVKSTGAKLTVAHYRRGLPLFLKIKELINNNLVGDIRTVQIRLWKSEKHFLVSDTETNWRVNPDLSGGGYFHDLAPHQLDLMLFYFGAPAKYSGYSINQSRNNQADDHVCGQLIFENGIVVNGSWCFNVSENQEVDTCEIVGTKGKITFPFFGNELAWDIGKGEYVQTFDRPPHVEQAMITQVVSYFNGLQHNPCTIEEAVTVMEIMDEFVKQ